MHQTYQKQQQFWPLQHYCQPISGAEPFAPHQFKPEQKPINPELIPRIFLMPKAYADMLAIAQASGRDEIGWLGSVRTIDDYQFLIEKIFLMKQIVHGATTEMTEDGLSDFFTDLANEDPELCGRILFWGHVHPGNNTDPSSQDEEQMGLFNHNDWFIRGIFGRSGRAEFSLFDYRRRIIWQDIAWQIYAPITEERQDFWKREIANKVSSMVIVYQGGKHNFPEGLATAPRQSRISGFKTRKTNIVGKAGVAEKEEEEEENWGFNSNLNSPANSPQPSYEDTQRFLREQEE